MVVRAHRAAEGASNVSEPEALPQAIHSGVVDIAGYKLTVVQLDTGLRVYEDNAEFRRLLRDLGMLADEPEEQPK
jgi:hypothetical protein